MIDASSIDVIDVTALHKLDELRTELAAEGVSLHYARAKRHLERFFNEDFARERRKVAKRYRFQTPKPAINALLKQRKANGRIVPAEADPEAGPVGRQWTDAAQPPREERPDAVPVPPASKGP